MSTTFTIAMQHRLVDGDDPLGQFLWHLESFVAGDDEFDHVDRMTTIAKRMRRSRELGSIGELRFEVT